MKKILLVEDEESLVNVLTLNLELEGFHVDVALNGKEALEKFDSKYDLVVLDVMLPEMSGFDVCLEIRKTSIVPILFTSAKGTSLDRITGLKYGADDYLVKPFNLEEFLLRVGILIERKKERGIEDEFKFGSNVINFKTYTIIAKGKNMSVSKREIELLKLLISKKNEVVSRNEILDEVWGTESYPTSRTIDNYILNFRKYFEDQPKNPQYFKSLRGVGYKFEYFS
ncbi:response regulator transcription factor [Crocinitomix catalasitica]|uniref:response regulator transcription factor n=1 Tax=Crocinitomix catalasitica TaxID=184607 RepID=UPI00048018F6|nr:response regulator transcription factor [Crocinitomix catalasitica]